MIKTTPFEMVFIIRVILQSFAEALKSYTRDHPFDAGNGDGETVLDQLHQAYAESHESDPPEISEGFKELECFLESLPLRDNNAVFNLCCRLCTDYEKKAFRHGLLYGAHLLLCVRRRGTTARPPKSDTLTAENRHPFRRSDSWKNWRGDRHDVSPHAVLFSL